MTSASRDLLKAVDQLGTSSWSGTAYRFTSPKRSPLSGRGAYMYGGRWNPRESFPCIYLAQPKRACIAEFDRRAEKAGVRRESMLPQTLHRIEVDDLQVLDLAEYGALERVGLTIEDIGDDDHSACAEVGAAAHFLGHQGTHAPSATGIGFVIAVFDKNAEPGQLSVVNSELMDFA